MLSYLRKLVILIKCRKFSKFYILFNLALYDSVAGVFEAIFPSQAEMTKLYDIETVDFSKLYKRIFHLMFKRART